MASASYTSQRVHAVRTAAPRHFTGVNAPLATCPSKSFLHSSWMIPPSPYGKKNSRTAAVGTHGCPHAALASMAVGIVAVPSPYHVPYHVVSALPPLCFSVTDYAVRPPLQEYAPSF